MYTVLCIDEKQRFPKGLVEWSYTNELAQNKKTIIGSYPESGYSIIRIPDDESSRKRDFDKRLPGTFQHDTPYFLPLFFIFLHLTKKVFLKCLKCQRIECLRKCLHVKYIKLGHPPNFFLHFEIRRFLGINWQY